MWMVDIKVGKNNDRVRTLANTNKLLKSYDGLDGIKLNIPTRLSIVYLQAKKVILDLSV